MRAYFLAWAVLFGCASPLLGGTFEFDLTEFAAADFSEFDVNLDTRFSEITSVEIMIRGDFEPALVRSVSPGLNTNPVMPFDALLLSITVGEVGSNPFVRPYRTYPSLRGLTGEIELSLPLPEVELGTIYFLPPELDTSTYEALLDGEFSVSIGKIEALPSVYQQVESASFTTEQLVLRINGTIVPEPSSLGILAFGLLGGCLALRTRQPIRGFH